MVTIFTKDNHVENKCFKTVNICAYFCFKLFFVNFCIKNLTAVQMTAVEVLLQINKSLKLLRLTPTLRNFFDSH